MRVNEKTITALKTLIQRTLTNRAALALLFVLAFVVVGTTTRTFADDGNANGDTHMITIYDRGVEQTIITRAKTVGAALNQAQITLDPTDRVEPAVDEELVADQYNVNIYRARPVVIMDGTTQIKTTTAAQSTSTIAKAAEITLYPEDDAKLGRIDDVLAEGGAGLKLEIDRATPFQFTLYGKKYEARTQETTVGDMLQDKGIVLGANDGVSPIASTPLTSGLDVRVWRDGKQVVTIEEAVAKPIEEIKDADREIGYRRVKTPGTDGKRAATYEIETKNGIEVARREIASVVTLQPVKEVVVVGAKFRGAYTTPSQNETIAWNFFISKGLTREQTAGIMGNIMQEHGFNTTGDGLAQWTGSRKAKLMAMPDPYSVDTQLAFMWIELTGGYASTLNNIRSQSTVEGAVVAFQNGYEKCGVCAESKRIQFAYNILASH